MIAAAIAGTLLVVAYWRVHVRPPCVRPLDLGRSDDGVDVRDHRPARSPR